MQTPDEDFPPGLEKYSETPIFTHESVPEKLTRRHSTKPGIWGKLVVLNGALDYVRAEPVHDRRRLNAGDIGVIAPQALHWVELQADAEFRVEFYRKPVKTQV